MVLNSSHSGISNGLRRDCSHKVNVSFGSFEEHRKTRRQSSFAISTLAIFRAGKQPWIVLSVALRNCHTLGKQRED